MCISHVKECGNNSWFKMKAGALFLCMAQTAPPLLSPPFTSKVKLWMLENSEVVDGNGDPPKRKRSFDLRGIILGFGYSKMTFDCFLCHCTDISSLYGHGQNIL